ncbi:MAG: DUF2075 domain-containing protein [Lachnospiraceae bacterium]|nr:DUF2075 domain-containing protein [Lachnospiraceae bacterium]
MKPINIYALTRIDGEQRLAKTERQMSERSHMLKIKEWEIEGLARVSERLCQYMENGEGVRFFYSFIMPKLGKEFDLLRIDEKTIVNIELKSGAVTDEAIRKQLLQNRYYLMTLGKSAVFYTYVSSSDRLVRLSNSGRLVEANWEELALVLENQKNLYEGPIENLFREEQFLISPLTDPEKFLRREYFLTSQQREIKKQILREIVSWESDKDSLCIQGITGLPGTGKTILLYDIALELSEKEKVCVLHYGSYADKLQKLDHRLKRVDFFERSIHNAVDVTGGPYAAILVDEGHRIDEEEFAMIRELARDWNAPVIVSYDKEDAISVLERKNMGCVLIETEESFIRHKLTNRIRLNNELSAFIACLMRDKGRDQRHHYPSVSLAFANNLEECICLVDCLRREEYVYLWDRELSCAAAFPEEFVKESEVCQPVEAAASGCKEYDQVMMVMDRSFFYDEDGFLRKDLLQVNAEANIVLNLFHGLSRAKKKIAIVVLEQQELYDRILHVLQ